MLCMRRMVRYMVRYIVRYTESQFPPSDLFIMPTDNYIVRYTKSQFPPSDLFIMPTDNYIVRYTESQFPPSDLFIMPTDITAPANILLMSIINIFPGSKWWWTKQYDHLSCLPCSWYACVLI